MYASSSDSHHSLVVGVYGGSSIADEDYERCLASIVSSDAAAASRGTPHVCVLVTDHQTPPPPPVWRQRMAQANNGMRSTHHHFAFVSPNVLVRGVFTAVVWLTRARPGHHRSAFSSFPDAASWIRANTGQPYPTLEACFESARRALREGKPNS